MIDWRGSRRDGPDARGGRALAEWCAPARAAMRAAGRAARIETAPSALVDALADGAALGDIYRDAVEETRRTYAPKLTAG